MSVNIKFETDLRSHFYNFFIGRCHDPIEVSLNVCAPIFATAPNNSRINGARHAMKYSRQRSSSKTIFRITYDHRSNISDDVSIGRSVVSLRNVVDI